MLEKLRIVFTIPELRQKILLTLGLLAIYRVGWQVPLPIVDPKAMTAFAQESGGIGDLLRGEPFDRGLGAHRHEDRRTDLPVGGLQDAEARGRGRIGLKQGEHGGKLGGRGAK